MASAFEGEAIVSLTTIDSTQAGAGSTTAYTVPAGKYARVWLYEASLDINGDTPFITIGTSSVLGRIAAIAGDANFGITGVGNNSPGEVGSSTQIASEFILTAGQTIVLTGGASGGVAIAKGTALEYANP